MAGLDSPRKLCSENMEDLEQDSKNSLRDYLSVLAETREVNSWDEVFKSILREEHHLALLGDETLIYAVTERLVDMLLLPPGCRSKRAVCKILEAYIRCCFEYSFSQDSEAMFHCLRKVRKNGAYTSAFTSAPVDIWKRSHIRYGNIRLEKLLHAAWDKILYGADLRILRILLSYGVDVRMRMESKEFGYCLLLDAVSSSASLYPTPNMPPFPDFSRLGTFYETLIQNDGRMSSRNQRGLVRIPHILESLYAVGQSPERKREAHVRCLQAYWNTFPDPLVSEEEVREFLLLWIDDDRRTDAVDQTVDTFVRLFGRRAYEPRRLSHLCRCTVRRTIVLNAAVTLPAAVELLHLPSAIKSFILCNPERLSQQ